MSTDGVFGLTVDLHYLGGACPVQAEGSINGIPFYFRARGNGWSMSIGEDPVDICCGYKDGWRRESEWGDEPYEAGYMPEYEAIAIIERCAFDFYAKTTEPA